MRRFENHELDPEIAMELAALDAALRGEAVDPHHAELAELAVLVAAERPQIAPAFGTELDRRVARRFASPPRSVPASRTRPRTRRRVWLLSGVASAAAAALAAVVVVGSSTQPAERLTTTTTATAPSAQSAPSAGASGASGASGAASVSGAPAAVPRPSAGGRKIVQSAQLSLATSPARIEDVSGHVFEVVRLEGGFVGQSNVTATGGTDGYAQFQLNVPSANLPDAMARLSRLHGAHVASRTDTTQDVNDQYGSLTRRLADSRALRTVLLKQLGAAGDPQRISSLKSQIADADAAIGRAQSSLNSLNHQINYTQISLTVSADAKSAAGGGLTIGRAAHDAGRVLTVAAAIALIALAALGPLALVGAVLWWVVAALRRRRREQALDLA